MSSKKETKVTNTYNPASMNTYNAFQPQIQNTLSDYAKNPLESTFFNTRTQLALNNARQLGQRGTQNLLRNVSFTSGGSNMPGYVNSLLASQNRANSAMESNVFNQNLLQAESDRKWATASQMGYQPLQTGQTTVQKTSGVGTWLPQVIGAGAAIGGAFLTGGASLASLGRGLGAAAGMGGGWAGSQGGGQGGGGYWTPPSTPVMPNYNPPANGWAVPLGGYGRSNNYFVQGNTTYGRA